MRTKDWKVTPELLLKKRLGICSYYIARYRKEANTYQHWYLCASSIHSPKTRSFTVAPPSDKVTTRSYKELKVGKLSLQPILPGRVCSQWRVLHKAMGERGRVLDQALLAQIHTVSMAHLYLSCMNS